MDQTSSLASEMIITPPKHKFLLYLDGKINDCITVLIPLYQDNTIGWKS